MVRTHECDVLRAFRVVSRQLDCRFDGLGGEMRTIALNSLIEYPGRQLEMAAVATAEQLVMVESGAGVHDRVWHTYGIFERFIPSEVSAMHAARQQRGALDFTDINRLHVPVALLSMMVMLGLLIRFRGDKFDDLALLAATSTLAILGNAFLCGVLSGPHDRYGARIAWLATFVISIAAMRAIRRVPARENRGHGTVTAAP